MSEDHQIILHALPRGRFRADWNGSVLLESSEEPLFESCRELKARGLTGTLRMRHAGSAHFAMTVNIEAGAGLTAVEGKLRGPRIIKWQPFGGLADPTDSGPRMPAIFAGVALGQPKTKMGRQRATFDTGNTSPELEVSST